ncbi:MAG: signal peptidase II [Myxococcales bacterium]|nr:signal peptidase II [Myxococcales bacterium]
MRRHALFIAVAGTCLGIDQGTKHAVMAEIPYQRSVEVLPGVLRLRHVHNEAAAFGLLRQVPEAWRIPVLVGVSGAAILLILAMYRSTRPDRPASVLGLALVLGGALGNLYDRVSYGHVVDFIQFQGRLRDWYWQWPTFNAADVFISLGVGLLIVDLLRRGDPDPLDAPEAERPSEALSHAADVPEPETLEHS